MSATTSSFINSFRYLPKELFRINNGRNVRLREWSVRRARSFDLLSESGRVKPKAMDPSTYAAPNGASMRPNTPKQHEILGNFKGSEVIVYSVAQGTALPDDLILVHEHTDHYSLQPAVEMTLDELNTRITDFLQSNATVYTKEQWLNAYRSSLESEAEQATPSASYQMSPSYQLSPSYQVPASTQAPTLTGDGTWLWSEEYQRYYYIDEDGSYVWDQEVEETEMSASTSKSKNGKGKGKGTRR